MQISFRGPFESSIINFSAVSFLQYIGKLETIGQHVRGKQTRTVFASLCDSKDAGSAQAKKGDDYISTGLIVNRDRGGFEHLGMAQESGLDLT
jgi:hypothetical protein